MYAVLLDQKGYTVICANCLGAYISGPSFRDIWDLTDQTWPRRDFCNPRLKSMNSPTIRLSVFKCVNKLLTWRFYT